MMNKKRLAALAMSAVMAAGTVSIPVNAADFSDGAAVQEEVAVQSVDVTEDVVDAAGEITITNATWGTDLSTPSLTVTVNGEKETYTTGFEKKEIPATCTTKGGYKWYIKIYDEPFLSDLVETTDALGHQLEEYTKEEPAASCEIGGTLNTYEKCTREGCTYEKLVKTDPIPAKGHTIDPNADTTKVTYSVDAVTTAEQGKPYNTKLDSNGKVVLADPTKPGAYIVRTEGLCTVCGDKTYEDEFKTLTATVIEEASIKIIATENIDETVAYDGKVFTKFSDVAELPKAEDIQLVNCDKPGSYTYVVCGTNGEVVDTVEVDVEAHHVFKSFNNPPQKGVDYEPVDTKDKDYLTAELNDKGELVVTNNTCLKDVKYNVKKTCKVCGDVVKEEKVAPKSTKHSLSTTIQSLQKTIQGYVDNKEVRDYDALLNEIKGVDKFVKVVNVTATCDKKGTADVEFYCQVCGEKAATISGVNVSMDHKYVTKSENKVEATCQSAGSYDSVKACERCGKVESRETITIPRLLHTNETKEGGEVVDNKITIGKSEASIKFIGSLVFGQDIKTVDQENKLINPTIGQNYEDASGNVITSGKVSVVVVTDCAVCHNHQVRLDPSTALTLAIKSVTPETTDVVTGKATAPGSITLVATYKKEGEQTLTKEITLPYYSKATDTTVGYTGLHKDVDGVYRYYVNGEFDEDYSGIVDFDGGQYVVANGVLCKDASGLNLVGDEWYFLTEGRIRTEVTQLVEYDGEWFFVADGKLDTSVNDLVEYDGETFVFVDGRLAQEGNGLWIGEEGVWYFLSNGRVAEEHTGLAMYDDEWFYVVEGKLAVDYSGTVEFEGGTFKVDHGMVKGQVK